MSQNSIKLNDGRSVYVQAKGLKVSARGRVMHAAQAVASLSKGERRRVRKTLRSLNRRDLVQDTLVPLDTVEALQR